MCERELIEFDHGEWGETGFPTPSCLATACGAEPRPAGASRIRTDAAELGFRRVDVAQPSAVRTDVQQRCQRR